MRLLALAGDPAALIAQIRLVQPLRALCAQRGWLLTVKAFHDCARADLAHAEVLVVQRAATARVLRLQQRMRQHGGAVVYEIDDLLTAIAPHISNQAAVSARQAMLRRCLRESDVVSVSTARLAGELGTDVDAQAAVVVPNHALPGADQPLPVQADGAPVTLLFASSDRLATDFIYPAVSALQRVQVVVVGPPAAAFVAAGISVQAEPLMARERFVAFARGLPNPLAVIPLEDSRFAACKSAIKWFDYAEAGIPTLCSAVTPYAEVMLDGVTGGLVANDSVAWQAALQQAVDDAAWRQRVAVAARAQVRREHTLAHTLAGWQQAIETALVRRAALPPPAPGLGWRLHERLAGALEGGLLELRALNRARLAKRARR